MNTYKKFAANVFVAQCDAEHQKGDVIEVETKYGNVHECVIFNLVGKKDGAFYYSIVRADGFNYQKWCEKRAERLQGFAQNATRRAEEHYAKSRKDAGFLSLGEPIKVGHHSENRHRRAIENVDTQMRAFVEEQGAATSYNARAEYWNARAEDVNLSMPESVEYYELKLEEATEYHEGLKSGKYKREHGYALAYANTARKKAQEQYDLAKKLWG